MTKLPERQLLHMTERLDDGALLRNVAEIATKVLAIDRDAVLDIEERDYGWDARDRFVVIRYNRWETDEEYKARVDREAVVRRAAEQRAATRKAKKLEAERKEYERLKKKFESQ